MTDDLNSEGENGDEDDEDDVHDIDHAKLPKEAVRVHSGSASGSVSASASVSRSVGTSGNDSGRWTVDSRRYFWSECRCGSGVDWTSRRSNTRSF